MASGHLSSRLNKKGPRGGRQVENVSVSSAQVCWEVRSRLASAIVSTLPAAQKNTHTHTVTARLRAPQSPRVAYVAFSAHICAHGTRSMQCKNSTYVNVCTTQASASTDRHSVRKGVVAEREVVCKVRRCPLVTPQAPRVAPVAVSAHLLSLTIRRRLGCVRSHVPVIVLYIVLSLFLVSCLVDVRSYVLALHFHFSIVLVARRRFFLKKRVDLKIRARSWRCQFYLGGVVARMSSWRGSPGVQMSAKPRRTFCDEGLDFPPRPRT